MILKWYLIIAEICKRIFFEEGKIKIQKNCQKWVGKVWIILWVCGASADQLEKKLSDDQLGSAQAEQILV